MDYEAVLQFWFEEIEPGQRWQKDAEFDQQISRRFGAAHQAASQCELFHWRSSASGRLAEIIVLDQFSRNIYRDQPGAFAQDALALALAQQAIAQGDRQSLQVEQRTFLCMPYMHSESPLIHQQALELFSDPGMEDNLRFEHRHKEIIDRFGRYPHRNSVLGRQSSAEEITFLQQPGSSF
ncbi:MAG: DUF924 domain-containing protein [Motiliproteus sp.]|nr:DUF924 domain-containing protein [Motiliproteus sp.]MCW9052041.1 DUF924 domain-containing protein [Motiliproteus sp.]